MVTTSHLNPTQFVPCFKDNSAAVIAQFFAIVHATWEAQHPTGGQTPLIPRFYLCPAQYVPAIYELEQQEYGASMKARTFAPRLIIDLTNDNREVEEVVQLAITKHAAGIVLPWSITDDGQLGRYARGLNTARTTGRAVGQPPYIILRAPTTKTDKAVDITNRLPIDGLIVPPEYAMRAHHRLEDRRIVIADLGDVPVRNKAHLHLLELQTVLSHL